MSARAGLEHGDVQPRSRDGGEDDVAEELLLSGTAEGARDEGERAKVSRACRSPVWRRGAERDDERHELCWKGGDRRL